MRLYRRNHRSFVLIAVLVVIGSATLVATSMIVIAQGRAADTAGTADVAQMRALAWSGVQLVMSELSDQRQRVLAGEPPRLDSQYTVYENNSRAGVVRLLPMSADGQKLFSSEAGKLDLGVVSPGMLGLTGMVDAAAAEAIVAHRDQTLKRPYQSVAELLHVPGASITPPMLYGPIEELNLRDQAQQESMDIAERVAARLQTDRVRGLADVVTVFAVEPNVQRGGAPRINLNQPWSNELEGQIAAAVGEELSKQIKSMVEQGLKFESDKALIKALKDGNIAPKLWPGFLDAFTTQPDEFCFGRLDINSAPLPALMSLPEINAAQAAQIVSMREELPEEEKSSVAWLVIEQIISPEALIAMVERITTRCFTFRVRVAAGEVDGDDPEGPMNNPVILEAVIDLSMPKPRVAYLRDVSVLQAAAQIALEASQNQSLLGEIASDVDPAPATSAADDESRDVNASATAERNPAPMNSEQPPTEPTAAGVERDRRLGRWLNGG